MEAYNAPALIGNKALPFVYRSSDAGQSPRSDYVNIAEEAEVYTKRHCLGRSLAHPCAGVEINACGIYIKFPRNGILLAGADLLSGFIP